MKLKDVYFEGKRKDNTKYSSFSIKVATDVVALHYNFQSMEEEDDCHIDLAFSRKEYEAAIANLVKTGKSEILGQKGGLQIEKKDTNLFDIILSAPISMMNRASKHYFLGIQSAFYE